ncbi:serine/threonine protein phosphatase, putative [Plasmodium reichenowi]|uniref:Serine/threonine-protein phosphatase n=1 Tax=Plasmodium reichenowi TaxID=5854 RepID=A0A060RTM0_PLARE|nr:serine/threonine protein phosphatase, putative [Plasmodium reichenowi]
MEKYSKVIKKNEGLLNSSSVEGIHYNKFSSDDSVYIKRNNLDKMHYAYNKDNNNNNDNNRNIVRKGFMPIETYEDIKEDTNSNNHNNNNYHNNYHNNNYYGRHHHNNILKNYKYDNYNKNGFKKYDDLNKYYSLIPNNKNNAHIDEYPNYRVSNKLKGTNINNHLNDPHIFKTSEYNYKNVIDKDISYHMYPMHNNIPYIHNMKSTHTIKSKNCDLNNISQNLYVSSNPYISLDSYDNIIYSPKIGNYPIHLNENIFITSRDMNSSSRQIYKYINNNNVLNNNMDSHMNKMNEHIHTKETKNYTLQECPHYIYESNVNIEKDYYINDNNICGGAKKKIISYHLEEKNHKMDDSKGTMKRNINNVNYVKINHKVNDDNKKVNYDDNNKKVNDDDNNKKVNDDDNNKKVNDDDNNKKVNDNDNNKKVNDDDNNKKVNYDDNNKKVNDDDNNKKVNDDDNNKKVNDNDDNNKKVNDNDDNNNISKDIRYDEKNNFMKWMSHNKLMKNIISSYNEDVNIENHGLFNLLFDIYGFNKDIFKEYLVHNKEETIKDVIKNILNELSNEKNNKISEKLIFLKYLFNEYGHTEYPNLISLKNFKLIFKNYKNIFSSDKIVLFIFNCLDRGKRYHITQTDFIIGMLACSPQINNDISDDTGKLRHQLIFRAYDLDRDGYLNDNEFLVFLYHIYELSQNLQYSKLKNDKKKLKEFVIQEKNKIMKDKKKKISYDIFYHLVLTKQIQGTTNLLRSNYDVSSVVKKYFLYTYAKNFITDTYINMDTSFFITTKKYIKNEHLKTQNFPNHENEVHIIHNDEVICNQDDHHKANYVTNQYDNLAQEKKETHSEDHFHDSISNNNSYADVNACMGEMHVACDESEQNVEEHPYEGVREMVHSESEEAEKCLEVKQEIKGDMDFIQSGDAASGGVECVDVECADVECIDVECADVECADVEGADVECADVECVDVECADVECVDVECVDVECVDVECADVEGADEQSNNHIPIKDKINNEDVFFDNNNDKEHIRSNSSNEESFTNQLKDEINSSNEKDDEEKEDSLKKTEKLNEEHIEKDGNNISYLLNNNNIVNCNGVDIQNNISERNIIYNMNDNLYDNVAKDRYNYFEYDKKPINNEEDMNKNNNNDNINCNKNVSYTNINKFVTNNKEYFINNKNNENDKKMFPSYKEQKNSTNMNKSLPHFGKKEDDIQDNVINKELHIEHIIEDKIERIKKLVKIYREKYITDHRLNTLNQDIAFKIFTMFYKVCYGKKKHTYTSFFEKFQICTYNDILLLCDEVAKLFKMENSLENVTLPCKVFGDVHGNLYDLLDFFNLYNWPMHNNKNLLLTETDLRKFEYIHNDKDIHIDKNKDMQYNDNDIKYVFLGNLINRGNYSLEVICLLFSLKILFPKHIYLLRGNHEDRLFNYIYGFYKDIEIKMKTNMEYMGIINYQEQVISAHSYELFNRINDVFEFFPLCVLLDKNILCIHGGIGDSVMTISDYQHIHKPILIPQNVDRYSNNKSEHVKKIIIDTLWSDPINYNDELDLQLLKNSSTYDIIPSRRGNITFKFGKHRLNDFLKNNQLKLIIRGHECVQEGYKYSYKRKLLTLFSAKNYCNKYNNNASNAFIVRKNKNIIIFNQILKCQHNCNTLINNENKQLTINQLQKNNFSNDKSNDKKTSPFFNNRHLTKKTFVSHGYLSKCDEELKNDQLNNHPSTKNCSGNNKNFNKDVDKNYMDGSGDNKNFNKDVDKNYMDGSGDNKNFNKDVGKIYMDGSGDNKNFNKDVDKSYMNGSGDNKEDLNNSSSVPTTNINELNKNGALSICENEVLMNNKYGVGSNISEQSRNSTENVASNNDMDINTVNQISKSIIKKKWRDTRTNQNLNSNKMNRNNNSQLINDMGSVNMCKEVEYEEADKIEKEVQREEQNDIQNNVQINLQNDVLKQVENINGEISNDNVHNKTDVHYISMNEINSDKIKSSHINDNVYDKNESSTFSFEHKETYDEKGDNEKEQRNLERADSEKKNIVNDDYDFYSYDEIYINSLINSKIWEKNDDDYKIIERKDTNDELYKIEDELQKQVNIHNVINEFFNNEEIYQEKTDSNYNMSNENESISGDNENSKKNYYSKLLKINEMYTNKHNDGEKIDEQMSDINSVDLINEFTSKSLDFMMPPNLGLGNRTQLKKDMSIKENNKDQRNNLTTLKSLRGDNNIKDSSNKMQMQCLPPDPKPQTKITFQKSLEKINDS